MPASVRVRKWRQDGTKIHDKSFTWAGPKLALYIYLFFRLHRIPLGRWVSHG